MKKKNQSTGMQLFQRGDLLFEEVELLPKEQMGLHHHPSWELCFIQVGQGQRQIGDDVEPFHPGDVVFVSPEVPHGWYFDPECTNEEGHIQNISLNFNTDLLEGLQQVFTSYIPIVQSLLQLKGGLHFVGSTAEHIRQLLLQMCQETEAGQCALLLQLLMVLASSKENRALGIQKTMPDSATSRLEKVQTYVRCNFNRNITVSQVAQYVGMNKTNFCTFFKQAQGCTFITYLNEYKLNTARHLLESTHLNVSEICYQSGFNDVPHFIRTYKRHFGVTPGKTVRK